MITLTQLEYVIAIDRTRSFGKAAKSCFVTQPTLSMQIQKLEEDLGGPLFDRSKKPTLPTALGLQIIEQAKRVLDEHKRLLELGNQKAGRLSGEMTLGVIPTIASDLIPLFINEFAKRYPGVRLKIEEHQTETMLRLLEQDQLDAGILATPTMNSHIQEEVLYYEPFDLYVSRQHELAAHSKIKEEDLDGCDVWLLTEGHCLRNQVVRFCSLKKNTSALKNVTFESGNLETLKRLVEKSGGYTLIPRLSSSSGPVSPKAKIIPFQTPIPTREVSLIYRRVALKKNILEALRGVIMEMLPADLERQKKKGLEVLKIT